MLDPELQQQLDKVRDLLTQIIDRLACAQVLDQAKVAPLKTELHSFVEMARDVWLLPKDLLSQLQLLRTLLQGRIEREPNPDAFQELDRFIEKAFGCLLGGGGMDDRKPGTPRII